MLVLAVKFELKPEYREEFLEASLDDARGANHDEPGCLRFDVIQDEKDPNRVFFYEAYTDQAAFDAHVKAPHFLRWKTAVQKEWHAAPQEVYRGWNVYPPDKEESVEKRP